MHRRVTSGFSPLDAKWKRGVAATAAAANDDDDNDDDAAAADDDDDGDDDDYDDDDNDDGGDDNDCRHGVAVNSIAAARSVAIAAVAATWRR